MRFVVSTIVVLALQLQQHVCTAGTSSGIDDDINLQLLEDDKRCVRVTGVADVCGDCVPTVLADIVANPDTTGQQVWERVVKSGVEENCMFLPDDLSIDYDPATWRTYHMVFGYLMQHEEKDCTQDGDIIQCGTCAGVKIPLVPNSDSGELEPDFEALTDDEDRNCEIVYKGGGGNQKVNTRDGGRALQTDCSHSGYSHAICLPDNGQGCRMHSYATGDVNGVLGYYPQSGGWSYGQHAYNDETINSNHGTMQKRAARVNFNGGKVKIRMSCGSATHYDSKDSPDYIVALVGHCLCNDPPTWEGW